MKKLHTKALSIVGLVIVIGCVLYGVVYFFGIRKSKIWIYGNSLDIATRFSFSNNGKIVLFDAPVGGEVKTFHCGYAVIPYFGRRGKRNIYTINLDNKFITQLTTVGNNAWPIFSPNGDKIAFISNRDGNDEVYIMDSNGTNQRRLTRSIFVDYPPSFSPDGSTIVFMRDTAIHKLNFFIINIADSKERQIFQDEYNPYYANPRFIDYKTVTFSTGVDTYLVDISKGKLISRRPKQYSIFSPDGKKKAFTKHMGQNNDGEIIKEIFVSDSDGKNKIQLTNNGFCNRIRCFSPDSKTILFLSGPSSSRDNLSLWEVDIDGSNLHRINVELGQIYKIR